MPAPTRFVLQAAAAGLFALLLGCAGNMTSVGHGGEAGFRHRELGYTISDPSTASAPAWERTDVEGTDVAFRVAGLPAKRSSRMSLQSDCRATRADPSMLARHLRIGLPSPTLLQGGPVEVDGGTGWSQVFDTPTAAGNLRVKTVTARVGDCTFDWILIAREPFEPLEQSFDAWWQSFRRPQLGAGRAWRAADFS